MNKDYFEIFKQILIVFTIITLLIGQIYFLYLSFLFGSLLMFFLSLILPISSIIGAYSFFIQIPNWVIHFFS